MNFTCPHCDRDTTLTVLNYSDHTSNNANNDTINNDSTTNNGLSLNEVSVKGHSQCIIN